MLWSASCTCLIRSAVGKRFGFLRELSAGEVILRETGELQWNLGFQLKGHSAPGD
jgi:hypothetical protein